MNIFTEIDKLFSPNKYNLDGAKAKLADAKAKNKPLLIAKWQKVVNDLQARDAALSGNAAAPGTGASGFSQTLQTGLNVANMLVGGPPQQQMAPVAAPKPRETPSFLSQYGVVLMAGGVVVAGAGAFIYFRKRGGGPKRNPRRRNPRSWEAEADAQQMLNWERGEAGFSYADHLDAGGRPQKRRKAKVTRRSYRAEDHARRATRRGMSPEDRLLQDIYSAQRRR